MYRDRREKWICIFRHFAYCIPNPWTNERYCTSIIIYRSDIVAFYSKFMSEVIRFVFNLEKILHYFRSYTKNQPKFYRSFLLSIWWITFFKHLYSLNVIMECIEVNWLCKYIKKVRSSQAATLVLWVSKTVFPCEYC